MLQSLKDVSDTATLTVRFADGLLRFSFVPCIPCHVTRIDCPSQSATCGIETLGL